MSRGAEFTELAAVERRDLFPCCDVDMEEFRPTLRSFMSSARFCEISFPGLERGMLSDLVDAPSSKQTEHGEGSPSVTINGVGP